MAALLFFSCGQRENSDDPYVARAYDEYLYASDLQNVIVGDVSPEDSAKIATTFINNWLKEKAELAQAELNLTEQQKDFDERLQNYYTKLVIYAYENELVRQKLNTKVTEEEILEHYLGNEKEFELAQTIVRVRYLCASDLDEKEFRIIDRSFFSDEEAVSETRVICEQQNAEYFDGSEQWTTISELARALNYEDIQHLETLVEQEKIRSEVEGRLFFIHFVDHKLKGSLSPLSLEREKIKSMILNKRKIELIANMQQDLLEKAMGSGDIEVYINE